MNKIVKNFSTVRLTRKEFLIYVGVVVIGIIGIPTILKVLGEIKPNTKTSKTRTRDFGSGAYGV